MEKEEGFAVDLQRRTERERAVLRGLEGMRLMKAAAQRGCVRLSPEMEMRPGG